MGLFQKYTILFVICEQGLHSVQVSLSSRFVSNTLTNSSPPRPPHSTKVPKSQKDLHVVDDKDLPPHHLMLLHFPSDEESLPRKLWSIAAKSTNLSARTLRRLPVVSLAMYARLDPCPIDEALGALAQAVEDESLGQQGFGTGETET